MGKKLYTKVLALMLVMGVGYASFMHCYGSFPLVRTIYKFNGSIGDSSKAGGILRSIVMLLLAFFPVYGFSFFIDAILFNTIEFWTGKKMDFSGIPQNDILELKEEEGKLVILDKRNGIQFYAFQERPGQFFIKEDGIYKPVNVEVQGDMIQVKVEERVLHSKKLSPQEKHYVSSL